MKEKMIKFIMEKIILADNQECKTLIDWCKKFDGVFDFPTDKSIIEFLMDNYVINMARVLYALNLKAEIQTEIIYKNDQLYICTFGKSDAFYWKSKKPLEEQSDETIEKIAKILGYEK